MFLPLLNTTWHTKSVQNKKYIDASFLEFIRAEFVSYSSFRRVSGQSTDCYFSVFIVSLFVNVPSMRKRESENKYESH